MVRGGIVPLASTSGGSSTYQYAFGASTIEIRPWTYQEIRDDDVLVMFISHHSTSWAAPTGDWTLLCRELSGADTRGEVYWRRGVAGERASILNF